MDLNAALRSARKTQPYITTNSMVIFSTDSSDVTASPSHLFPNGSQHLQPSAAEQLQPAGAPATLSVGHIMDVVRFI